MRAFELALFIVMIAASFVMIAVMQVFPSYIVTVTVPQEMLSTYSVNNLAQFDPSNMGILDYFVLMVKLIIDSIRWSLALVLTIAYMFAFLFTGIGLPTALAQPLSVGVWFVVVIAIAQIWRAYSIDTMR